MIRMVLVGETFFEGEGGYRETLESRLIQYQPNNNIEFTHFQETELTLEKTLSGLPQHVIGKSPNLILISLGYIDLWKFSNVQETFIRFKDILSMLMDKTTAQIFFTNIASSLILGDEPAYKRSLDFNSQIEKEGEFSSINMIDIDNPVKKFIEIHRNGTGEKRSLLKSPDQLSNLGKLVISDFVFKTINKQMKKEDLWKN